MAVREQGGPDTAIRGQTMQTPTHEASDDYRPYQGYETIEPYQGCKMQDHRIAPSRGMSYPVINASGGDPPLTCTQQSGFESLGEDWSVGDCSVDIIGVLGESCKQHGCKKPTEE